MSFILKFLVCLVFKNFRTDEILAPGMQPKENVLFKVIETNPIFKNALEVMIKDELSLKDKKQLI